MSYVEREADARLAAMQERAEAAEARLAQIAELLTPVPWRDREDVLDEALRLARGEEPA
jgi:hypothetical protein